MPKKGKKYKTIRQIIDDYRATQQSDVLLIINLGRLGTDYVVIGKIKGAKKNPERATRIVRKIEERASLRGMETHIIPPASFAFVPIR